MVVIGPRHILRLTRTGRDDLAIQLLLRTLGRSELDVQGHVIPLRSTELVLLAYVALSPRRTVDRDQLAHFLRPGAGKKNARQSLSQLLYQIRQKAGASVLHTSANAVATPNLLTDVELVRGRIRQRDYFGIIQDFRASFLSSVQVDSPTIEQWRETVDCTLAVDLGILVEAHISQAAPADIPALLGLVQSVRQRHPHELTLVRTEIAGLIRVGELGQAKAVYEAQMDCDDCDLPPFESLAKGLSDQNTNEDAFVVGFVGRDLELSKLMSRWHEVVSGKGQVITILGEPGIGKSRLADQLLRRIAIRGGRVWSFDCSVATQRLPFATVQNFLTVELSENDLRKLSVGRSLVENRPDEPHSSPIHPDERKHALVSELTSLALRTSSATPLAIFVDDAQWADDFLALLLRVWSDKLRSEKVLIILTARTHDAEPTPTWIMSDINPTETIDLGSLDDSDAGRLIDEYQRQRRSLLPESVRQTLIAQCAGRPLLILEALSMPYGSLAASHNIALPESVEHLLRKRFRNAHHQANWISGLLAVLGRPITPAELVRFSGLADHDVAIALEWLNERGITTWDNGHVLFPHELMRETAYRRLVPTTRSLLHLKTAEQLASANAEPHLLAQHYAGAGEKEQAGNASIAAAEKALSQHLYSDSEYYFKLAITAGTSRHAERAASELVRYYLQVGRAEDAAGLLTYLRDNEHYDKRLLSKMIEIERELGSGTRTAGELIERAKSLIDYAADGCLDDLGPCYATIVDVALDAGHEDFGKDLVAALEAAIARSSSPVIRGELASILAVWEALNSSNDAAIHRLESMTAPTRDTGHDRGRVQWWACYGTVQLLAGNVSDALLRLATAMRLAESACDLRQQVVVRMNTGVALLEAARFRDAQIQFEIVNASPNMHFRVRSQANIAVLYFEWQDENRCLAAVQALLASNYSYRSPTFECLGYALRGLTALRRERMTQAQECHQMVSDFVTASPEIAHTSYVAQFLATMATIHDDVESGMQMLDSALKRWMGRDQLAYIRLLCDKGELLLKASPDAAYPLFREALGAAKAGGAQLLEVRAQTLLEEAKLYPA